MKEILLLLLMQVLTTNKTEIIHVKKEAKNTVDVEAASSETSMNGCPPLLSSGVPILAQSNNEISSPILGLTHTVTNSFGDSDAAVEIPAESFVGSNGGSGVEDRKSVV